MMVDASLEWLEKQGIEPEKSVVDLTPLEETLVSEGWLESDVRKAAKKFDYEEPDMRKWLKKKLQRPKRIMRVVDASRRKRQKERKNRNKKAQKDEELLAECGIYEKAIRQWGLMSYNPTLTSYTLITIPYCM